MAQMHVTNESPTKITLELDPAWRVKTSETYAESIKQGRGCFGAIAITFLLILSILGYSFFTNSLGSLPWYFWAFAVILLTVGAILVIFEASFQSSHNNRAEEATVTIDLDSQRAVRVEKLKSGKTTRNELKLEQVTQVLVCGDDAGHRLTVTLESQNDPSFNLNSDVYFDSKPMIELGKKLGAFIKKPVVFKITEAGKPVSEETVQP